MTPGSPDDIRSLIDNASAEFWDAADDLDETIAELRAEREQRRDDVDSELSRALHDASRNPDAPESLRRIVARVERGQLSWSDVVNGTDDPDVADLRTTAFAVAREHYEPDATEPDADEQGGEADTLVGDDDTSTAARLR